AVRRVPGVSGARGEIHQVEETLYTRAGNERTVLASTEPIELDGQAYYLNTLLDITARKHAEEKMRAGEEELRALVTSLDDIVFEVDEHGTYLNVWTANETMLFAPRDQVIGKRF